MGMTDLWLFVWRGQDSAGVLGTGYWHVRARVGGGGLYLLGLVEARLGECSGLGGRAGGQPGGPSHKV